MRRFYAEALGITDEKLLDIVVPISRIKTVEKGALLIRHGERQSHVTFLMEGLLRGFYLDPDGRDVTDCFGLHPWTPAMACCGLNDLSPITIEALTPSRVVRIPYEAVMELLERDVRLVQMYNTLLLKSVQEHWQVKTMVCQHTATERYQWFLEEYPGLIDRVNNRYVASYLGMSPVTLSRIRGSLRESSEENM
ncbi:MAG: Crp/Fnr family transcriptional regulator [Evtepia sp.]|uniref:Crp/Fnr family transcriptional regulator n=1 Tax=Evtepia sp. TaxID=2773933 RepID=UPI002A758BA5|nr:Crp/Fnr family transcriptional regulator [Evtepia sp.]MDY3014425.1 Crp/Fnr family transcriptional regulator [Evtepia sp.]